MRLGPCLLGPKFPNKQQTAQEIHKCNKLDQNINKLKDSHMPNNTSNQF